MPSGNSYLLFLELRNAAGIENDEPARENQFDYEDEDGELQVGNAIFVHGHMNDMEQEDEEESENEDDFDDLSNSGGSNAEHSEESTSEDERQDESHMPDDSQLEASAMEVDASAMEDDRSSTSSDQEEMEHEEMDRAPNRMEVQLELGDETIQDIDEEEDEEEDRENETDSEEEPDVLDELFDPDYVEAEMRGGLGGPARVAAIRDHGHGFVPPPDNFFEDFEMLAASANYFADYLAATNGEGMRRFVAGIPMDLGVLRSGPIGAGPSESGVILSQHPLLTRPTMTANPPPANERQATENENLASMHNYALRTILIGDHDTVTIADRDIHHARHRYPVSLSWNYFFENPFRF